MKKRLNNSRGSITVEAAIVLPILLCAILTIGMFSKVYYVHEIIHHALTETAYEISDISYLYYVSGINEIQKQLDETLDDYGSFEEVENMEDVANWLISNIYDEGKSQFGNTVVKQLIKKYLVTSNQNNIDIRLKSLNIMDGWAGLNFKSSSYLSNHQNIDLIVKYKIKLPLPIRFVSEIPIIQRVSLRAWMEGSLPSDFNDVEISENKFPNDLVDEFIDAGYDVWSLKVFQRGREIKKMLGRNLDENFPIIDILKDNQVISIRTHDTRVSSNQGRGLYYQLTADIRQLEGYTVKTYNGVTIGPQNYKEKVFNVVIPDEALTEEQIKSIRDAKEYAANRKIKVKVTVVR